MRLKASYGDALTHVWCYAHADTQVTGLKACYAIPLTRQGHVVSVVVFYSRLTMWGARLAVYVGVALGCNTAGGCACGAACAAGGMRQWHATCRPPALMCAGAGSATGMLARAVSDACKWRV